jgi:D-alanyl-D-alanine carboxypeptidase
VQRRTLGPPVLHPSPRKALVTSRLLAIIGAFGLVLALASPAVGPFASFVGDIVEPAPVAASVPAPPPTPARATVLDPADELLAFGGPVAPGSTRGLDVGSPVVGVVASTKGTGAWVAAADGGVFAFGDSTFKGSAGATRLNKPIVGLAGTPADGGYWLVASDGGIFAYGDATFLGSTGAITLNKPIVGMARTPSGLGYWLVASDGGVFAYGDATFLGSMGAVRLNKPVVGIAATPTGLGYWMVASDGGIFAFGDATFFGSTGAITLQAPIVGIAPAADAAGYRLAAKDGGVFAYGSADFRGSAGGDHLSGDVVGVTPVAPVVTAPPGPSGDTAGGYWLLVRRDALPVPSPAAYVMTDQVSGAPIVGSSIHVQRRPASTSKMLTALVAVRRLPADATIPISPRAAGVSGAGAGAKAGEVWTMEDALHGLLMPSGNDIAYALAERVSGSVEAFGPVMAEVAKEVGAAGTWNDPAGLDGNLAVRGGNSATTFDLSQIARAVLDNPRLAPVVDTATYTYSQGYGVPHTVNNSNRLVRTDPTVYGVKTGTTDAAGPSVVIAAKRRNRAVVVVVLGAAEDRFATAQAILDNTPSPAHAI